MDAHDEHMVCLAAATAALNELNCAGPYEARAEIVAQYLKLVDGEARVMNPDGTPRTTPCMLGTGRDLPFPITRLIGELLHTEPRLRWRPLFDSQPGIPLR